MSGSQTPAASTKAKQFLMKYDKYEKLLSNGMPDEFVKRKMISDGIKKKDVNNFFAKLEENESYTCTSNMPGTLLQRNLSRFLNEETSPKIEELSELKRVRSLSISRSTKRLDCINSVEDFKNVSCY